LTVPSSSSSTTLSSCAQLEGSLAAVSVTVRVDLNCVRSARPWNGECSLQHYTSTDR
jgi:hypothetical protein